MGIELNLAVLAEAVAEQVPDRPAIVQGSTVHTYAELRDRTRRLARFLADDGRGAHQERSELAAHQAGQDLMAQLMHNCPEYVEGMLGAFRGRLAPFNVNYRYVADELRYLFRDAAPAVIQYHASFAPLLAEVLPDCPSVELLLQVDDGSGHPLLPGAVDYEAALASVPPEVDVCPSPDDLYVLYTGGTTGMPKGVLWRQADAAVTLMAQRDRASGQEWTSLADRLAVLPTRPLRLMPLAPFMHGAAQWAALGAVLDGHTLVIPEQVFRFDPASVVETIARHGVNVFTLVGDAYALPLADELERSPRELPSVRTIVSGGAALTATQKARLGACIPSAVIVENMGSSETGPQGRITGVGSGRPMFAPETSTVVVSDDRTRFVEPGEDHLGWLATAGRIPLGYLGDEAKTAQTFPTVRGRRVSLPGDRARLHADGLVEVLGREAVTINSGGEKIFGEEVEAAIKSHPDVRDAVVCGRPSERWGSEVVALVALRDGVAVAPDVLIAHCATRITRYKLPKAIVFVDEVTRSAVGKADYRWALARAAAG